MRLFLFGGAVALAVAAQQGNAGDAAETAPGVRVVQSAIEQTQYTRFYDPSYVRIPYPGGDVPLERGVCTDVIIRAFRAAGVDLQKEIYVDMAANYVEYPPKWGQRRPDRSIDHRRVPNLMTFFERKGKSLAISNDPASYLPGDVVAWDLGRGILHVGIVTDVKSGDGLRRLLVHNLGSGAKIEDILQSWKIMGHYRYF